MAKTRQHSSLIVLPAPTLCTDFMNGFVVQLGFCLNPARAAYGAFQPFSNIRNRKGSGQWQFCGYQVALAETVEAISPDGSTCARKVAKRYSTRIGLLRQAKLHPLRAEGSVYSIASAMR